MRLKFKKEKRHLYFFPHWVQSKVWDVEQKVKEERKKVHEEAHNKCSWPSLSEKRTFYKVPWWAFPNVILPCPESLARAIPQKDYFSYLPSAHLDRCLEEFLFPLSSPCLLAPTGRSDWVYQRDTLFVEKRCVIGGLCKWQATAWNWSQEFWRWASVALGAMK